MKKIIDNIINDIIIKYNNPKEVYNYYDKLKKLKHKMNYMEELEFDKVLSKYNTKLVRNLKKIRNVKLKNNKDIDFRKQRLFVQDDLLLVYTDRRPLDEHYDDNVYLTKLKALKDDTTLQEIRSLEEVSVVNKKGEVIHKYTNLYYQLWIKLENIIDIVDFEKINLNYLVDNYDELKTIRHSMNKVELPKSDKYKNLKEKYNYLRDLSEHEYIKLVSKLNIRYIPYEYIKTSIYKMTKDILLEKNDMKVLYDSVIKELEQIFMFIIPFEFKVDVLTTKEYSKDTEEKTFRNNKRIDTILTNERIPLPVILERWKDIPNKDIFKNHEQIKISLELIKKLNIKNVSLLGDKIYFNDKGKYISNKFSREQVEEALKI